MDQTLYNRILPVVRRAQIRRVGVSLALIGFVAAAIVGLLWFFSQKNEIDPVASLWVAMGATMVAGLVAVLVAIFRAKNPAEIVVDIEKKYPELDAVLITAVEQRPADGARLGFLQMDVMRRAVTHSYQHRWSSVIPGWHLVAAPLAGFIGCCAFAVTMIGWIWFGNPAAIDDTIAFADAVVAKTSYEISVEPGNAEVERGTSLLVLARFGNSIPPEANLVMIDSEGIETRLPMLKSLDDPVFGARISGIQQPTSYQVQYASQETPWFNVTVFDYPKLIRADAILTYPGYTARPVKVVQDVRRLTAVEGTIVDLSFFVNKEVVTAVFVPRNGDLDPPIQLTRDSTDPRKLTARILLEHSQKYELRLTDADNRENRSPPNISLNVLLNRPPDLKVAAPGRDVQASPLEEIQLTATAWDDFGINQIGLSYGIAGSESHDVLLEQKPGEKKRIQADHLLALESLEAKPDDLVSYFFWAEDFGPDGEIRRVMGDMYFAEVRHFEEIFRQGQAQTEGQQQQQQQEQQQQQGGENAQQAQELAELQKQIMSATWKLIRRETRDELSDAFLDDTALIAESQTTAIGQLAELAENLEDAQSKSFVETVRTFMNEAVLHLNQAHNDSDASLLKAALSSEQAAYQGMLKLRAREHEVVRQQQQQQQQQQQSSQQNNRAQQQLDQLNLNEDESRYETERTAEQQTEQSQQQQEDRQVLSRLRELARRQDDLNERVKELQSALEEAETEEEREEIERRLKSLREQQEQMLRDTDELLERMQEEGNQQRMSEEAEQLEQTRENIRQASEALEQGEVSQAAAEGTRAQRELEDLRDEFQDRTSGQFNEEMRQMRNEAQELEQRQQDISEQLDNPETPADRNASRSLRDDDDAEADSLQQQLADQQLAVEELREQMRTTIEEAEPFEPLLAEELYDTYRDSEVSRPDTALESARRSLDRGWDEDARIEEQRAREGIQQMREGIERAAENVLGDETDALRVAQETLQGLNRDLNQELDEQDPTRTRPGQQNSEQQPGQPRDGEQPENDNPDQQPGEQGTGQQPGQPRDGEQPENDNPDQQPGEQGSGQQPGQPRDGEPSENDNPGQQPGERGTGQQPGQPRDGEPSENDNPNQPQGQPGNGQPGGEPQNSDEQIRQQIRDLGNNPPTQAGGRNQLGGAMDPNIARPISGEDFRDWSDRLRDVGEMIADPELRAEASRIREQALEIRRDMKRLSAEPNWDLVKMQIAKPLAELQNRVSEEIMRRSAKNARVPLDRDPVPVEYQDAVRKYYERLGVGQ